MDEDLPEIRLFASFERHDEFLALQNALLAVDLTVEPSRDENSAESELLRKLSLIVGGLIDVFHGVIVIECLTARGIPRTVLSARPVSRKPRHASRRVFTCTRTSLYL